MKDLCAKLSPSGRVAVYQKRVKPLRHAPRSCPWTPEGAARRQAIAALGGVQVAELIGVSLGESEANPFPCQLPQKLETRAERAKRGLTRRGRYLIQDGAAVIEDNTDLRKLAFVTLTINDVIVRLGITLNDSERDERWAKALTRFNNDLRKLLLARGLPGEYVAVTEIHPGRDCDGWGGIPHVHMLLQTALKPFRWLLTPDEIKELWAAALAWAYGADKGDIGSLRVGLERVKKSVRNYMSKYLSKGSKKRVRQGMQPRLWCVPRRWYSLSNGMHEAVKKATHVLTGFPAAALVQALNEQLSELVWRKGYIERPNGFGGMTKFAQWFRLSEPIDPSFLKGIVSLQG